MGYVLAKIFGVNMDDIKKMLKSEEQKHAQQGLRIEHLWVNYENPNEVLYLFQAEDLSKAKQFIDNAHAQARRENPKARLPNITFLKKQSMDE